MIPVIKKSIWSFSGQTIGGLTNFMGIFLISYFLGPRVVGSYSLFVAIIVFSSLITTLNSDEALKKRIAEGSHQGQYMGSALSFGVISSILVSLIALVMWDDIIGYIGGNLSYLLFPAALLSRTTYQAIISFLYGSDKIQSVSIIESINATVRVLFWIIAIHVGTGANGIIIGYCVGFVGSILISAFLFSIPLSRPGVPALQSLLEFTRYGWSTNVKGTVWVWLDTIILGFFVSQEYIGIYEVAWQITGVLFFAAAAVSNATFATISQSSDRQDRHTVRDQISFTISFAGIISIPGIVGLVLVGKDLLELFGSSYSIGFLWLIILAAARLVHSYEEVLTRGLNAINRPDLSNTSNLILLSLNGLSTLLLTYVFGPIGAATAVLISMSIGVAVSSKLLSQEINFDVQYKEVLSQIGGVSIMGSILYLIKPHIPSTALGTGFLILIGGIIYSICILLFSPSIKNAIQDQL